MTRTALEAWKADGFLVAPSLLEPIRIDATLASIKHAYDQVLHFHRLPVGRSIEQSMKSLHGANLDNYLKVTGALWRKLSVYELLHDPAIAGFLSTLLGWREIFIPGGQVVHVMSDMLRIPGGYHGFSAHQDWPSVRGSLDGLVVWVPLMDIDAGLYPLEVIPGSHQAGQLPLKQDPDNPWEVHPDYYDDADFVPVEVRKGDVVFMSNFTVHRSSPQGAFDRVRLACSTRYDNGDEPSFIERGYPSAYRRSIDRAED